MQGLEPACIRGRLSEWNFKAGRIKLKIPHRYDQPQHQQQALTAVLQQLRELQADGTDVVDLHDCHWTAELAAAAASALPALEHLRMGVYVKELTDELLGLLLTLGPYIRCVGTDTLKLQSDQHANTPWPWEVLRVYSTALPKQPWAAAQLLRLPNPEHRVQPELGRPEVHCLGSMTDVTDAVSCTIHTAHTRVGYFQPLDISVSFCVMCAVKTVTLLRRQIMCIDCMQ